MNKKFYSLFICLIICKKTNWSKQNIGLTKKRTIALTNDNLKNKKHHLANPKMRNNKKNIMEKPKNLSKN